ncbi:hypothetical protein YTPLAS18_07780 [Nitrospira sp.]|nr:hypothetical protein YTPLAS18_07780 [Nitrospira sp.]
MNNHLPKPFTKEHLHATVEQWLSYRIGSSEGSRGHNTDEEVSILTDSTSAQRSGEAVDRGAWKIFDQLDEPGQPNSLSHFMEIFLRDTTRKMAELREAVAAGNTSTVGKLAHSLKSVSSLLGALRLAAYCKSLEAHGFDSALKPIQALFPQMEEEFQAVCGIFKDELTKRGLDPP